MTTSPETRLSRCACGERGGSRLNLIITLAIIGLVGYSAFQYMPVAYHAYLFKDAMQETVNLAAGSNRDVDWVKSKLRESAKENDLPQDAVIDVQTREGRIEARVRWVRNIALPGYVYQYHFDHTEMSSTFLAPR
jgi:hypothetical protein